MLCCFPAICSSLDDLAPGLIDDFLPPPGGEESQDLTISNTVCSNLSIQNIEITSSRTSDQLVVVPVGFDGFQMTCNGDMKFALGSVSGTADFSITATANPLDIDFGFASDNYNMLPPSNSTVLSCNAALTTENAVVSNLVTTNVPEALTGTLQDLIDSLIGDIIQTQGAERKYLASE